MSPDDARLGPADLEREYSPSSRVGGTAAPFIDDYIARSVAAIADLGDRVHVMPGGTRLVAGRPDRPVLVFIHGGYWQALSAEHSMYLAPGALAHGWSYVAVEYTIAPTGTLEQMVDECRRAIAAALANLRARGCNGPVVLAGHSAGAHLAAMVTLVDDRSIADAAAGSPIGDDGGRPGTAADGAFDERRVASAPVDTRRSGGAAAGGIGRTAGRLSGIERVVLVSGVFDLRPIVHTTVNDPLGLTPQQAIAASPVLHAVAADDTTPVDVVVTWGDDDTTAFARQSRTYADILHQAGHRVTALEAEHRHHFDIVDDLVDHASPLGRLVVEGL